MSAPTPKVFLSYSHDSESHAERVRSLADRLRADGIDCAIDQYEPAPPQGWPLRYEIASSLALDFALPLANQLRSLIARIEEQPDTFNLGWSFAGTLRFIRQEETLSSRRDDLVLLFEAIQAPNRDAIVEGLRQLGARLSAIPDPLQEPEAEPPRPESHRRVPIPEGRARFQF